MKRKQIQSDLQRMADDIVKQETVLRRLPYKIRVHLKDIKRGRSRFNTGYVSIPIWAVNRGDAYLRYYLIHEVCHFMAQTERGHGKQFKHYEKHYLALYGMRPVYKRAYVRQLLSLDGLVVYDSKWNTACLLF